MTDSDLPAGEAVPPGVDVGEVARVVRRPRSDDGRRAGRPRGTGRTRHPSARRGLWWQLGTTAAFAVLLVGLVVVGYRASLLITGGGTSKVTDPKAPGYVAEVRPTPVDMVAVTGDDGALASVLIIATSQSGSGGTVSVLPWTVAPGAGADGAYRNLRTLFADGGLDEVRSQLAAGMTFGFSSAEQLPAQTMKALVGLVGPVSVSNVDNLIDAPDRAKLDHDRTTEVVRYRAGDVHLQPDEVTPFLAFAGIGEAPDSQLLRQEAVWKQVLGPLEGKDLSRLGKDGGTNGAGAVTDLLTQLVGGDITYETVPTAPKNIPGTIFTAFIPDPAALPTYVSRVVPFPTSAFPGQRARVELLNGTRRSDAAVLVAPKVVAAGGEISLLGNASSFDVKSTTVEYLAPEAEDAAQQIAATLGVKATRAPSSSGGVDVRVVVGTDRTS